MGWRSLSCCSGRPDTTSPLLSWCDGIRLPIGLFGFFTERERERVAAAAAAEVEKKRVKEGTEEESVSVRACVCVCEMEMVVFEGGG